MIMVNNYVRKPQPIIIYTDGSCDNKRDRKMGIGVYARYNYKEIKFSKYIGIGTNNIAELSAIYHAIKKCNRYKNIPIRIYTDSQYAINVITGRYKAKKNKKLINKIKHLIKEYRSIKLVWVKGHNKSKGNKIADKLANQARVNKRSFKRKSKNNFSKSYPIMINNNGNTYIKI